MASPYQVVSTAYPFVSIRVDIRGHRYQGLALLDTGFTWELVVPRDLLSEETGLPEEHADWELADGRVVDAPVYLGSLEIVGLPPITSVAVIALGTEYVLGRGVLDRFEVVFDHGERVIVNL